jgi:hypothetical protein
MYRLPLQGYESIHELVTMTMKAVRSSKLLEAITQPHGATTQKNQFLNMKTGLQILKVFELGVVVIRGFQWVVRQGSRNSTD